MLRPPTVTWRLAEIVWETAVLAAFVLLEEEEVPLLEDSLVLGTLPETDESPPGVSVPGLSVSGLSVPGLSVPGVLPEIVWAAAFALIAMGSASSMGTQSATANVLAKIFLRVAFFIDKTSFDS